jgi:AbiJ N-terminal domain 4
MSIFETYTKRLRKREQAGQPDVYQYDDLPQPLRIQIILIWNDAIGSSVKRGKSTGSSEVWDFIHDRLCKEMGVFYLSDDEHADSEAACKQFLMSASTNEALDIIELSFRCIAHMGQLLKWSEQSAITQGPDDAMEELTNRFKEHGVGYQFVEGEIVRMDSQYLHAEVVKPAVSLLNTAEFRGASEEFLKAHEHYRKGRLGEALSEAFKAFESTMKAVCDEDVARR